MKILTVNNDQPVIPSPLGGTKFVSLLVSSFGQGTGVPATLTRLDGEVPQAPYESRLAESMAEVKDAGAEALAEVQAAAQALQEAFDAGAG